MNPYRKESKRPELAPERTDRGPGYRAARIRLAAGALTMVAAAASLPMIARSCRGPRSRHVPPELLDAAKRFPTAERALEPAVPLEPLLAADAPDRLAVLEPSETAQNLRPGQPLMVRFNRPMVEGALVGKPAAIDPLEFSPSIKGRATWTSRSALLFEAAPATWDRTRTATMTLSPDLRSLAGEDVAELTPRTIVFDDGPRFIGRAHGSRLLAGEPVRLQFSGKVDARALGSELMVYEVDGGRRMIPFAVGAPVHAKGVTTIELELTRTLEPGAHFAVAVAPPLSSGGSTPRVVDLELAPRPRVEGVDCAAKARAAEDCKFNESPGEIIDIEQELRLLSSAPLGGLSANAIEVTPKLDALELKLEEDKRIVVRGEWTPGQVYQVRVKGLRDEDGHALERLAPLAVRSAGRAPEVRVAGGRLTYESDAPAKLPFSAVHVEEGQARVAAIPIGREIEAVVTPDRWIASEQGAPWTGVPLHDLVPGSRPNRWASGSLAWSEVSSSHPSMAVVSLLADRAAAAASSLPATFVQKTDLGIEAKVLDRGVGVWITSIDKAMPSAGAHVTLADRNGLTIGEAEADERGIAWFAVADRMRVDQGVLVRALKGSDRAVMAVDPRSSIGPRHLGVSAGEAVPAANEWNATVFTDRGIVRPGEVVHAKALVRSRVEGALVAPSAGQGELALFGPTGEAPLATRIAAVSAFGTIDADFPIGSDLEPGNYRVEFLVSGQARRAGVASFTVGEYRPPAFRIDLSSREGGLVEREPLSVDVLAAHLFGAPAAGLDARWTITREPARDPAGWDEFSFEAVETPSPRGTMASGEIKLDEAGRGAVDAKVAIGSRVRAEAVVEVSVRDLSGLTTSARKRLELYPATYEVGVREVPAWIERGKTLDVEAIVVGHDGKAVKGRAVEARVLREGWHAYWEWAGHRDRDDESDETDAPEESFQARKTHRVEVAARCKLTSGDEPVHCAFKPDRGGTYVLEATTRDEQGRESIASQRVYIAGEDEHPDRDPPGSKLTLTPSKTHWLVGETAEVVFESPFADAEALLQVEREGVIASEVRRVSSGGNVYRFVVTDAMVPNAFVTLSLVRPRTGPPQGKVDLSAPDLRVGLTEISARPATSPLVVSLEAAGIANGAEAKTRAGTDVPIAIDVADADGDAVVAEVALFAVDEGTLRVTGYATPDPLAGLFPRIGPSFAWDDLRRSLVSRVGEGLLADAGGDGESSPARRKSASDEERYEPTPLWLPRLMTDESGHASAVLHLPERPTQYRIMAVATDAGVRAGRAEQTVIASMPIVVRPVMPSVATAGDRFFAAAFVHDTEDSAEDVDVTAIVDGVARPATTLHIGAKGEARAGEWIELQHAGDTVVRFEARAHGSGATASSESRVHVEPRGRTARADAVGAIERSRTIQIELPNGVEDGTFSLAIASHPFVGFDTAVDALIAAPDAGVETTASSVIGLAAYAKLDTGRRPGSIGDAELKARASSAIARLIALQAPNGGFGEYSRNDSPDAYLSAYALHALSSAARAGFAVDPAARKRAYAFLDKAIRDGDLFPPSWDRRHDVLALVLRALAEEGHPDLERTKALFDQRELLTPYGLSELALAMDVDDFRRVTLVLDAELRVLATPADERKNPSVLAWYDSSARTLGALLEAVATTDATSSATQVIASHLLEARSRPEASWWSTHETSHALAGLAAFASMWSSDERLSARVWIDGAPIEATAKNAALAWYSLPAKRFARGPHELSMDVDGPAFFAVGSRFVVPLGEADRVARGHDVALHRVLEDASGKPLGDSPHVKVGDLVRVRLFLFSEHEAPPYLAVRDPLAGGLEPLDAGHETTARASLSALLGMGDDDDVVDVRAHYASRSLELISRRAFLPAESVFYLAHAGTGLHELTYGVRAVTAGTFTLRPAEVEALYARDFRARSAASTITVDP